MIIDFNAYVGHWPEHDIDLKAAGLPKLMESAGIDLAVASDLDTLYDAGHVDSIAALSDSRIVHFPIVSPGTDLSRWKNGRVKGIRIFPAYHDWSTLDDLLAQAEQARLVVHVCLRLRDQRLMIPIKESADVMNQLEPAIEAHPGVRFVLTGATLFDIKDRKSLFVRPNVWVETSHIQYVMNGLLKLVDLVGSEHVLFGSNTPFYYTGSNIFRIKHSDTSDEVKDQILWRNAKTLLEEGR
ncbi:MAG TPA: amidohydrolase family protein [Armatimonadota bacterium]|jgi:predicted TIM-barrel fold metal-dependent hydrolase